MCFKLQVALYMYMYLLCTQLLTLNDSARGMLLKDEEPIDWTDLSQQPDFVIGDEVRP